MRIGELARKLGVHPDTIRRLEKAGAFRATRDWTGARRFTAEDLATLRALLFPRATEAER